MPPPLPPEMPPEFASPLSEPDTDAAAHLQGVTLVRGDTRILGGVDLTLPRGAYTALLGANGCGKTTLSRLLLGQLYPTAGRVTVLGETLGRTDVRRLRQRIGIVNPTTDAAAGPGSYHVNGAVVDANLSATDAVCTGYFATVGLYDRPTDVQRGRARTLLQSVGLGHRTDHRFGVLSTGEQRRALIARALVHRPELLILDEPTAGLDIAGREQVLATVESVLQSDDAPAVLMITHHVEELSPRCDRVLVMQRGRITHAGPPDDVLTPEALSAASGCKVFVRKNHGRFWLEVLPEAWVELTKTSGPH